MHFVTIHQAFNSETSSIGRWSRVQCVGRTICHQSHLAVCCILVCRCVLINLMSWILSIVGYLLDNIHCCQLRYEYSYIHALCVCMCVFYGFHLGRDLLLCVCVWGILGNMYEAAGESVVTPILANYRKCGYRWISLRQYSLLSITVWI